MTEPAHPRRFVRGPNGLEAVDPELPLDYTAVEEAPLRAAFAELELSRHYTFEAAMKIPALAIGVRNAADAIAKRRELHSEAPQPDARDWLLGPPPDPIDPPDPGEDP